MVEGLGNTAIAVDADGVPHLRRTPRAGPARRRARVGEPVAPPVTEGNRGYAYETL